MPLHIDDHNIDGQLPFTELTAKGQELVVRVGPILAPPVAEDIFRRQRHAAGNLGIIRQGGLVIVTVSKKIQVLTLPFRTAGHPRAPVGIILLEKVTGTFINDSPAVAGKYALLHGVAVIDVIRAGTAVQCACRTHKIALVFKAGIPPHGFTVHLEAGLQIICRKRPAICLVLQGEPFSFQDKISAFAGYGKCRNRKIPVYNCKRSAIFELAVCGPFHADQPVCKNGKACISFNHRRPFRGKRIIVCHGR